MSTITIRQATHEDFEQIAQLHTVSWRSAYRGLLSDQYLDGDLEGERKNYWYIKMTSLSPRDFVLIAEDKGKTVGFIAVMDKSDNGLDALIDNLHVLPELKGHGIGGRLMKAAATIMKTSGLNSTYLWVLDGNVSASKFYKAKKGVTADVAEHNFGGKLVSATRFVWPNVDLLI